MIVIKIKITVHFKDHVKLNHVLNKVPNFVIWKIVIFMAIIVKINKNVLFIILNCVQKYFIKEETVYGLKI